MNIAAPVTETPTGRRIRPVAISAILVLLFVSIVAFLRRFGVEAAGFEQKGALLVLYHACRLALAFYIAVLCYCAGHRALELIRLSPEKYLNNSRNAFIVCFFLGASLYGIAFTLLGLAGLVTTQVGLALTVPILLVGYRPLAALLREIPKAVHAVRFDPHAGPLLASLVVLIAIGTALVFFLLRAAYIAVFDPNIWEHYLHYYRAVLASGSTQPNEVWHHFYASKAAGLIFLASALSDVFGAQLANACFMAVAGVIILDLLLEYCGSTSWALLGVALFFTFLCGQIADGATFKHHGVLLGYMSFTVWGTVRLLQQRGSRQLTPLIITLMVSLAYLGFYLPAMAVVLPPTFVLLVLMNVAPGRATRWYAGLLLMCSLFAGAALAFGTNWLLTGLAELTPVRWFWAIADHARFEKVFGTGGVEFFLGANNDLANEYDWSLNRMWKVLRYPLPATVIYYSCLVGILVMLIRNRVSEHIARPGKFLAILAAFAFPLGAFAQAFQTAAVDRMALYSIVFTTLASVVMLKGLLDIVFESTAWSVPSVLRRLVPINVGAKLCHAATIAIIGCTIGVAMAQSWTMVGKEERQIIYGYLSGQMSLQDTFHRVETVLHKQATGIGVLDMAAFRKTIGANERILRLAYDAGFSYALPGDGIVSEPTYALITNPRTLLAQPPHEVAAYLRERRINYFTLSLHSKLFTTVAFTSLFAANEMGRYFSVAYEDGDFFILTWRQDAHAAPISDDVLRVFELKRTGVLHYPFTERFDKLVSKGGQRLVVDTAGVDEIRNDFQSDLDHAFSTQMLPLVSLTTSRALLLRILQTGKDAVAAVDPGTRSGEPLLSRTSTKGREERILVEEARENDLRARFLAIFRGAIFNHYEREVGPVIASMSRACDERVPFAIYYPNDARC